MDRRGHLNFIHLPLVYNYLNPFIFLPPFFIFPEQDHKDPTVRCTELLSCYPTRSLSRTLRNFQPTNLHQSASPNMPLSTELTQVLGIRVPLVQVSTGWRRSLNHLWSIR